MKRKFNSPIAKAGVYLLIFSFVFLSISPSMLYAEIGGIPSKVEQAALQAGSEAAAVAANATEATPQSVGQAASIAAAQVAFAAGLTSEQAKDLSDLAAIKSTGATSVIEDWMWIGGVLFLFIGGMWWLIEESSDSGYTLTPAHPPGSP